MKTSTIHLMRNIRKNRVFFLVVPIAGFLFLWLLVHGGIAVRRGAYYWFNSFGEIFGVLGYLCLSFALLLSSRWKRLESWFGGLDYIYRLHRLLGIWGFCTILLHPTFLAFKRLPQGITRFFFYFLPVHARLSVNLGVFGFWFLVVLIAITFFRILPYDKWKMTHKGMSLVFVLASLHFLLLEGTAGWVLIFPMCIGLAAILYKQILVPFFIRFPSYIVTGVKQRNDTLVQIDLVPIDQRVSYIPGQYAFFSFVGEGLSTESHPFTLFGDPEGGAISIIAKARGDYTKKLFTHVKKGYRAEVEGPYGKFDYTKAAPHQIWIAGGIGIAPFISWIRDLQKVQKTIKSVHLFYAVHCEADLVFIEEFEHVARSIPSFHFTAFCSEKNQHLTIEAIQEHVPDLSQISILMCGPKRLTNDLFNRFVTHGVDRDAIYFEDFEFF